MDKDLTAIIVIAILALFLFIIFKYMNDEKPYLKILKNEPIFKNCVKYGSSNSVSATKVPINKNCPAGTKTCPQYFGCDNGNIPACWSKNSKGEYDNDSCPVCVDGEWKCDYFMMGAPSVISRPVDYKTGICSEDDYPDQTDRWTCEFDKCNGLGDDCHWGRFNSYGQFQYGAEGTSVDGVFTGYKIMSTGDEPLFRIKSSNDNGMGLGGDVTTINGVLSLDDCIGKAKEAYKYTDESGKTIEADGSYGFVYDGNKQICSLHRVGEDVVTDGTGKVVKGTKIF